MPRYLIQFTMPNGIICGSLGYVAILSLFWSEYVGKIIIVWINVGKLGHRKVNFS